MKHPSYVAIDFETADNGPDSACSVGAVKVANGRIVDRFHRLIRPPRQGFIFSYLHGITWGRVCTEPTFAGLWPQFEGFLDGAEFFAAHNARFDRKVLDTCCRAAKAIPPAQTFVCTVELARKMWDIRPTQLPAVCRRLSIELKHHEALSDAEACGRIVLAALKSGWKPDPATLKPGSFHWSSGAQV